jgi:cellulose synthase/poly-beta-1,6-N-acetylglucosamine synthase-like glycosyltransferase
VFLVSHGVPQATLELATRRAAENNTDPADELIALGLDARRYWSALAHELGATFLEDVSSLIVISNAGPLATDAVRVASAALVKFEGRVVLLAAPRGEEIALLKQRLARMPALAVRLRITTPDALRALIANGRRAALSHYAINRLARVLPALSTGRARPAGLWGHRTLVAALIAFGLAAPIATVNAIWLSFTLFFLNCSYWKLRAAFRRLRPPRVEPLSDGRLPRYSVLVPLYREAAVLPDLVAHLARLDYPATKLEVLLIVEEDDRETRAAIARAELPLRFEVVIVPPGGPRTKPKALTYALSFARGDYVAVFDAEDRPELDQLRRAAAAFRERPDLGCVQARLQPDNEGSWLARMFAVEYAANFEVLLPALAEWRVPLPLGGTSNHFPRAILEKVGAWDPYNVTEDADLGIRLARFGHASATINARTYEEAPVTFRQWLPQRRRWLKGWMQTVALSLRRDISPGLKLPLRERLAVHGVLTAGIVGLLLYPASLWLIALAVAAFLTGTHQTGIIASVLLAANIGNLFAIVVAAGISSLRGLIAARSVHLARHIFALPLYWALMSLAAWQALFQFFRAPSAWEKTKHGVARDRRAPKAPRLF